MTWLDVFTPASEIRPACPASKNFAGRDKSVDTVALSSTSSMSSMSSTEKAKENPNEETARLLSNVNIVDTPTPAQLAHARSLLVDCPSAGGKLHCWHCARCAKEMKCMAWRSIPAAEMRFQRSAAGKTYSLCLVESGAVEVLQ